MFFDWMDFCAAANAPEGILEEFGLRKAGNRLNLIAFCKSAEQSNENIEQSCEDNTKKKKALLEAFLKKKGKENIIE